MPEASFTIGQLAPATGCKVQTIRYYEEIGLMPAAERTMGNQRRYGQRQFKRLGIHPTQPRTWVPPRRNPRTFEPG